SPHIYISCIKQFWNTAVVKSSCDVTRLQALVDKKKIVIFEDVFREILQLDDAEVIQAQIVDLSSHTPCYISPALTEKVFSNMRRVGKGFSGVETPLFENMLGIREVDAEEEVQHVLDKCSALVLRIEGLETANTAQQLEIIKLKARVKKLERLNKVVAASTPISAAKPVAKPKVLKIVVVDPAVSTKKRKGVVIRYPKEELHDDTLAETLSTKDKGKGILVKDPKPMKKKDQIEMDAEYAR
nr:hypothetical protein [Tanacetum cinerariifolium]